MIGIYVHVPYCTVRCSYCDFYLVPVRGRDLERFGDTVCAEIDAVPSDLRRQVADTVHFGGGTPSILKPPLLQRILATLKATFRPAGDAEIALEANPEDIDEQRLAALRGSGVTRLTIGVQSLDDRLLREMRRPHTAARAVRAVIAARRSGIASLGVDLMIGLPHQDRSGVLRDISRLIDLGVDHLSLYVLEVHDRTRLGRAVKLGRVATMGDDVVAGLYEAACDRITATGFEQYEISNFARPGHRSRHNLKYWTDGDYLGFGPAAHSYVAGRRWSNAADLRAYLERGGAGCERLEDPQPPAVRGAEALCAGLRLAEGVDLDRLRQRYGDRLPEATHPAIVDFCSNGLLDREGARVWLTRRGRLVSNEILERLLPSGTVDRSMVS